MRVTDLERPALYLIKCAPVFPPGGQGLRPGVPEIRRQFADAGIEQVNIVQRLVGRIVLGVNAAGARLDTQVDVLGDQRHPPRRVFFL